MNQREDNSSKEPDDATVRLALDLAWRDHHHARDQTWRAIQIEAVLGAGLVTVESQFRNLGATCAAAILVIAAALFGVLISLHHRQLERRKFFHITNFEKYLGLRRKDLIPSFEDGKDGGVGEDDKDGGVRVPEPFSFWAVLNPRRHSTAVFILRMHIAIAVFAVIVLAARLYLAAQGQR